MGTLPPCRGVTAVMLAVNIARVLSETLASKQHRFQALSQFRVPLMFAGLFGGPQFLGWLEALNGGRCRD
jgi:hypothetical protein